MDDSALERMYAGDAETLFREKKNLNLFIVLIITIIYFKIFIRDTNVSTTVVSHKY